MTDTRLLAGAILIGSILITAGNIFVNRYGIAYHEGGGALIYDRLTGNIEVCSTSPEPAVRDLYGCWSVR